jgi:anti-sigma regulatory factor (Ser/Thr protein kinase)
VAVALNSVQTSAADLAVEQALLRRNIADSFVNLGRRNQNLLGRQIDSITQMERDEADPDNLERLFALDHLATRMRRNAESLLLLGGLDPHRQWSAPVPLIEVIRGALGEVEEYQRVSIRNLDEALVSGSAAADVTHMLAELIENALRFSPPTRDVEIVGRAVPGDYSLAIIDAGLGMTDEELERSNRRLSGQESFTVAPSRYLGHYVVGVQAARLGVQVHLQRSPGSGITARITLGDVLTEADADVPTNSWAPDAEPELVESEPGTVAVADEGAPRYELVTEPEPDRYVPPAPAAAPKARADLSVSEAPEPEPAAVTASGYKRRQRGANVPRTEVTVARRDEDAGTGEEIDTADSVRNLLSGLQAGADRARAERPGAGSPKEDFR